MNTGFIGIGRMGGMLVRVLLRSGGLATEDVWAANRSSAKVDAVAADFPAISWHMERANGVDSGHVGKMPAGTRLEGAIRRVVGIS